LDEEGERRIIKRKIDVLLHDYGYTYFNIPSLTLHEIIRIVLDYNREDLSLDSVNEWKDKMLDELRKEVKE